MNTVRFFCRAFTLLIGITIGTHVVQQAHAVSGETIFGVTTDNNLVRFNSQSPGTIDDTVAITGLESGENVLGIDFRPAANTLIALGSSSRLYTINVDTGVATAIGSSPFTPPLSGSNFGVDFNPVVDRFRIVSDNDQNLRINPDTGVTAGTDTALAFDAADTNNGANPSVVGVAYTVNITGGSSTSLFGIDSGVDSLVRQGSPNGSPTSPNTGTLFTIGTLGVNASTEVGFDIAPPRNGGSAFAAIRLEGETTSGLYAIDLGGGRATLIGAIGTTTAIRDISILRGGSVDFSQTTFFANENAGNATLTINRTGSTSGALPVPTPLGTPTPVTVTFSTTDGTAKAGTDYTQTQATVSFAEGETSKTVDVPITDDALGEGNKSFTVTLTSPTGGGIIGGSGSAVVTILENDLSPTSPDTTAPTILYTLPDPVARTKILGSGVRFDISSSEAATLTVNLVLPARFARRAGLGTGDTTVGTTSTSVSSAGVKTVTLRASSSVRTKLRRLSSYTANVVVIGTDSSNNSSTATEIIRVR